MSFETERKLATKQSLASGIARSALSLVERFVGSIQVVLYTNAQTDSTIILHKCKRTRVKMYKVIIRCRELSLHSCRNGLWDRILHSRAGSKCTSQ